MSDWNVGDRAVCVESAFYTRAGCVYTVAEVVEDGRLWFVGLPRLRVRPGSPRRFRKIRPDEQEPCEVEFVTLLKRSKVSA